MKRPALYPSIFFGIGLLALLPLAIGQVRELASPAPTMAAATPVQVQAKIGQAVRLTARIHTFDGERIIATPTADPPTLIQQTAIGYLVSSNADRLTIATATIASNGRHTYSHLLTYPRANIVTLHDVQTNAPLAFP